MKIRSLLIATALAASALTAVAVPAQASPVGASCVASTVARIGLIVPAMRVPVSFDCEPGVTSALWELTGPAGAVASVRFTAGETRGAFVIKDTAATGSYRLVGVSCTAGVDACTATSPSMGDPSTGATGTPIAVKRRSSVTIATKLTAGDPCFLLSGVVSRYTPAADEFRPWAGAGMTFSRWSATQQRWVAQFKRTTWSNGSFRVSLCNGRWSVDVASSATTFGLTFR
jgi:hypothetical protein